jgi:hypothetical protein
MVAVGGMESIGMEHERLFDHMMFDELEDAYEPRAVHWWRRSNGDCHQVL